MTWTHSGASAGMSSKLMTAFLQSTEWLVNRVADSQEAQQTSADAFYLEPWFGFVVLALWIVLPLVVGYLRFESADSCEVSLLSASLVMSQLAEVCQPSMGFTLCSTSAHSGISAPRSGVSRPLAT